MKYTPLDNIGLPTYDANGELTSRIAPGNNYPASELGIPKSSLVSTREQNIILTGKYEENEATYPLLNPVDSNVKMISDTTFRFLIKDVGSKQLYASEGMYNDLISAYEERNPWFTISTVPTINLDLSYLITYNQINKFKITEAYSDVIVNESIDTEERILRYIDWLVKPSLNVDEINIKPTTDLGSWEIGESGTFGLGFKRLYDSMNKDKDPDPEAVGTNLIEESFDLSIPDVTKVSPSLQPLPAEEVVPKLVEALLAPRKPPFEKGFSPLGEGLGALIAGGLLAAAGVVLLIGTGGAALPAILAGVAGLAPSAVTALNNTIKNRFGGSYIEFIIARTTDRGVTESRNSVFQKERRADERDWNSLLSVARQSLGTTQITVAQIKAALALALAAGSNTRPTDLSYTMKVGRITKETRRYTISVDNPYKISVTQK